MDNATNYHILVASLSFATSAVGLTVNCAVMVCLVRFKELRHSFGYLSVSLMLADSGVLAVVLMGIAPFTLFQEPSSEWNHKYFGHICMTFWFASLYGMAMIAINRYLVISHPQNYQEICSKQKTIFLIAFTWVLAAVHCCLYFIPGCHFHYEPTNYSWHYASSSCQKPMLLVDVVYGVIFVIFIYCLNMATAVSLHHHNKEMRTLIDCGIAERVMVQRYVREARFFLQALVHAVVFLLLLVSFHVITRFVTGSLARFFSSTWLWQIGHSTNGFLLLVFNDKLRRRILRIFACSNGLQTATATV